MCDTRKQLSLRVKLDTFENLLKVNPHGRVTDCTDIPEHMEAKVKKHVEDFAAKRNVYVVSAPPGKVYFFKKVEYHWFVEINKIKFYQLGTGVHLENLVEAFRQYAKCKTGVLDNKPFPKNCDRCNQKGVIPMFKHVCAGICFECWGTGYSLYKKLGQR